MSHQDEINRRYTDEMNRLLGPDAPAAAAAAVARRRRERMGDNDRDYDNGGGGGGMRDNHYHGRQHNEFAPFAAANAGPPLEDLEIRRTDTGLVSGLTGMGSAREAMMKRRREHYHRQEGMMMGRESRNHHHEREMMMAGSHVRDREGERQRDRRARQGENGGHDFSGYLEELDERGDQGERQGNSARKRRSRSWSPRDRREDHLQNRRDSRSPRIRNSSRRRRRRRYYSSSCSRSRSRSHSDLRGDSRRRRLRRDEARAGGRSNRRQGRRRRRRNHRHRSEERSTSPDGNHNNRRNRNNHENNRANGRDDEEQNVVSEDSDPYLLKHAVARIADLADLADKADSASVKKKCPHREGRDSGGSGKKKSQAHGHHRSRHRSPSSDDSDASSHSRSRSRSPSADRPYNPAPPGMLGYHNFSGSSPFKRSRSNNLPRNSRRRRRRHDHRSRSAGSGSVSNRDRRDKRRRRRRRDYGEDESYFSDASASSSASSRARRQQKHHGSRNDDRKYERRHFSRSRSFDDNGRPYKHHEDNKHSSKKDKKKKAKKHPDGKESDASSKDDTVGHFHGGPGTIIDHRYKIIRDVGMGTFGRVVQCENLRNRSSWEYSRDGGTPGSRGSRRSNSRFGDRCGEDRVDDDGTVAIKIVRSVRRYHESAVIEADICERVNREQSRQNKDLCARMLDRFSLPSGHYCLVFECLGRSLYDFLKGHDYQPFPLYCVRDFSRQLLEALEFLHGFGLIHTDLKPENILLSTNEETNRNWDGSTARVPVRTKVKVIDFGGATFDDEKKSSVVNTRQYRAPEVILGWGWSYPSDLWSAGCIVAELYAGELLFATHDNAEHLALMERACGPFRKELLDMSTSPLVRECFDSRGWHRIRGVLSSRSIEHVRKMAPLERIVSEHDRPTGLGRLLRALLTIDPKRRATAREALMTPFFTQIR